MMLKPKKLIALPADIFWLFFFSQQLFEFFQEPLGIWIVQGGAPAPHEHILRYWRVHRWMPTVFVFQDHVSRKEFFQSPPRPVQRLSAGYIGDTAKHLQVPEHLQERRMTYQLQVPEHLQERSMTYQLQVPEHLQETSPLT